MRPGKLVFRDKFGCSLVFLQSLKLSISTQFPRQSRELDFWHYYLRIVRLLEKPSIDCLKRGFMMRTGLRFLLLLFLISTLCVFTEAWWYEDCASGHSRFCCEMWHQRSREIWRLVCTDCKTPSSSTLKRLQIVAKLIPMYRRFKSWSASPLSKNLRCVLLSQKHGPCQLLIQWILHFSTLLQLSLRRIVNIRTQSFHRIHVQRLERLDVTSNSNRSRNKILRQ